MGMSTLVKGYGDARLWAAMVVLLPFTVLGLHIEVPPGAVPEHADTEVSTNMPFSVDGERTREIKIRFALDGCASNCIQVALGRDADGDGVLGVDEAETLYGWRNGRYFAESVADGLRVEEPDPGSAASRVLTLNLLLKKGEGLCGFAATNGVGVAVFTNLSTTAQSWLYKPDWNMMRVTRRGPGVPAEWFTYDLSSYYLYILMR